MKKIASVTLLFLTTLIFVGCPPETKPPPDSIDRWKRYTDEFDGLLDLVKQSNSPKSNVVRNAGKMYLISSAQASAYVVAKNLAFGDSVQLWVDFTKTTNDLCVKAGQGLDIASANANYTEWSAFYIFREDDSGPKELWIQNKPGNPYEQRLPFAGIVGDTCSLGLFFENSAVKFFFVDAGDTVKVWEMPRPAYPAFDIAVSAYDTDNNGEPAIERLTFLSTDSLDFSEPDTTELPPITGEKRPVNVSWSANTEIDLAWYTVYYTGYASGFQKVLAPKTTAEIELVIGEYYDLYVTAGDTVNNESGPSNVVPIRVAPPTFKTVKF